METILSGSVASHVDVIAIGATGLNSPIKLEDRRPVGLSFGVTTITAVSFKFLDYASNGIGTKRYVQDIDIGGDYTVQVSENTTLPLKVANFLGCAYFQIEANAAQSGTILDLEIRLLNTSA